MCRSKSPQALCDVEGQVIISDQARLTEDANDALHVKFEIFLDNRDALL